MSGNRFDSNQSGDDAAATAGKAAAAAALATPPIAAAAAVIDSAGDAVELAGDAVKGVGNAVDDLFGGSDEQPGQSTFPVDPNDPGYAPGYLRPGSPEAVAAQQAAADAAAMQANLDEAKHGEVDAAGAARRGTFGDFRQKSVGDHQKHTNADPSLNLSEGIAGPGAQGALDVGAPDGSMEGVATLDGNVAIGANPATPVDPRDVPDHDPAVVPAGSDVELNPQPIPPGDEAKGGKASIIIVGG